MPRVVMILTMLFVAPPLTELRVEQERGVPAILPMLTADTPKQCCRVCRKGKACGRSGSARRGQGAPATLPRPAS
jgi:hypothetical protein